MRMEFDVNRFEVFGLWAEMRKSLSCEAVIGERFFLELEISPCLTIVLVSQKAK